MKIPFFEELDSAQTILLAGAGGGFDVFCGLPLYSWLRNAGKTAHLANLSFADLGFCDAENPAPSLFRVTSRTNGSREYFPEIHLAAFLDKQFGDTPVYAIERTGAKPILGAYQWLANALKPDTLLLVDAGTDSLMRGDEAGLGTPQEDAASLFAANAVTGPQQKFLVSVGFGVDYFHGVCHAQFLENVALLSKTGGYLGAWSLSREMPEFDLYEQALAFVSARMPGKPSIVNTSIVAAINGGFGDQHPTKRTEGSELFLNPLMALHWAFDLTQVARRNLYLDQIGHTNSYGELSLAIEKFRATLPRTRPWKEIPC